ncbi:MAG: class I SAM-dependent rRNA methyltransferase [Bacteroidales bacterium]|jgi:23S rRNA (cytosine1962-C5)-methyltransferase|nr:class I SAM-dependent rRNA methyltransferase [Bacteroidales bacterium]
MITITLKRGKEQSVKRLHPWIFSGAIKKMSEKNPQEGSLVEVYDSEGGFLAKGHYQIGSIAIRVLTVNNEEITTAFYTERLEQAYALRKSLGLDNGEQNNTYRLIHGEGDFLPGLIIDMYAGVAVVQLHSVGMYRDLEMIVEALHNLFGDKLVAIYNKSENTLPFKANLNVKDEYLYGEPKEQFAVEYGNRFKINWEKGQKTGFFIDQRENRKLLESYSKNKDVLNVFGYTGGFSVYAMRGGAKTVQSVDISKRAIDLTNTNIEENFGDSPNHDAVAVDAFDYLNNIDQKFDLIVLDPPAFAKHMNVLNNALQAYKRINQKAIQQIKPGGILFTFSCSQVVSKENFRRSVFVAAANTGRKVRILHQLNQPADHPVNIYHPEGDYLKGLVLYVE